jgi:hypothetical protein
MRYFIMYGELGLKYMNDFLKGLGALGILFVLLLALPIAAPFVLLIMVLAGVAWFFGLVSGRRKNR